MEKILFVSGSERNGNCKYMLEQLQKNFWLELRTEVVHLRDYEIKNCTGCEQCEESDGHTCVCDDKFDILLDKVLESDIVVLASPNYFYNVSGLTKNFIDRTYRLYHDTQLQDKKFIYLYVGYGDSETTKKYLDNALYGFTICHQLNVLGSYAVSAEDVEMFRDEKELTETLENITNKIRENLSN